MLSLKENRGDRVPDFALGKWGDGVEAGFAGVPPLLNGFVGCHDCHIFIDVCAGVFKVAEEQVFSAGHWLMEDRVIFDVALRNCVQDARPWIGMEFDVFIELLGFDSGNMGVTFHGGRGGGVRFFRKD